MQLPQKMFTQLSKKLKELQTKYKDALLILGGDYNDAPDDNLDRIPPRVTQCSRLKCTALISDQLAVIDVWRYLNPYVKEYTWSNASKTFQSRIDVWYTSPLCLQFITAVHRSYAPLTDHKLITIHLKGVNQQQKKIQGFWKFNNNLLSDSEFCDSEGILYKGCNNDELSNPTQTWEYFKYQIRTLAIK